jgi:hypothetical protein
MATPRAKAIASRRPERAADPDLIFVRANIATLTNGADALKHHLNRGNVGETPPLREAMAWERP